jgi:excisionase family DNA binding protein
MPDLLTTRQLQEILHVDRTTIYRMADDGRIPAVRVGSQWRFPRRSIEGWLKSQSSVVVTADEAPTGKQHACELEKLLPVECVQKIQDTFADLLGVSLVITDLTGRPVTRISHPCGLFALLERAPLAMAELQREWAALANQPSLQPAFVPGYLRLLHTQGLVRVGSELKAVLVVGGIAPAQWPPSAHDVARLAEALDVDETTLRRHLVDVFVLDAGQRQTVLAYVQRVADIVAHIITERNLLFGKLQDIAELTKI